MKSIISLLREFDFSESEAKAYVVLLQNGSCSGYEISKLSGVSRSKIYNVLESLYQKGAISVNRDGSSSLYCAEPVEILSENIRRKTNRNLEELKAAADSVKTSNDDGHIWNMYDHDSVMTQAISMIKDAKDQVDIQLWAKDLTPELEEAILDAENRLEKVVVIFYDPEEQYHTKIKHVYKHGFEHRLLKELGGRWFMVVADNCNMLYSAFADAKMTDAFYTHNKNMAFFAKEFVHHDAYNLRIIERLKDEIVKEFGDDMDGIRDIYSL